MTRHLDDHPQARTLPVIVPVVVYHSADGWQPSTRFADLYDLPADAREAVLEHVPDFAFLLDDISRASDEELRRRAMSGLR